MSYLGFDLLLVLLPALLLLHGRRGPAVPPMAGLAGLALLWTAPWDEHLVRSGVWSYDPGRVLARWGSVPAEEYAFVLLEVLLVAAWARRAGVLAPAGVGAPAGRPRPAPPGDPWSRRRGALAWAAVAVAGLGLVAVGGQVRYLGLLLVWAAPPLALQRAVAGDVLRGLRRDRLLTWVVPVLWLCAADRLALADGIWAIAPGSSTGLAVLGLPAEEALFFCLTCLLVTDGLLLAGDPALLARVRGELCAAVARTCGARRHAAPRRTVGA